MRAAHCRCGCMRGHEPDWCRCPCHCLEIKLKAVADGLSWRVLRVHQIGGQFEDGTGQRYAALLDTVRRRVAYKPRWPAYRLLYSARDWGLIGPGEPEPMVTIDADDPAERHIALVRDRLVPRVLPMTAQVRAVMEAGREEDAHRLEVLRRLELAMGPRAVHDERGGLSCLIDEDRDIHRRVSVSDIGLGSGRVTVEADIETIEDILRVAVPRCEMFPRRDLE